MNFSLRKVTFLITALLLSVWSAPSHAADSTLKSIFTDSVYGGLTGTLVGAAVMAFASKPGDHLENMAYGAAAGVLAGAAFGIGKAVVEIDKGKVTYSLPMIIPDIQESNSRRHTPVVVTAELIHGKF